MNFSSTMDNLLTNGIFILGLLIDDQYPFIGGLWSNYSNKNGYF